jgi:hypothetical protein
MTCALPGSRSKPSEPSLCLPGGCAQFSRSPTDVALQVALDAQDRMEGAVLVHVSHTDASRVARVYRLVHVAQCARGGLASAAQFPRGTLRPCQIRARSVGKPRSTTGPTSGQTSRREYPTPQLTPTHATPPLVIPKLWPQASGEIPVLSKCARVASRHASADASSDLKNDSAPKTPPETITIQRCPRDLSPSALKTTEHPRSASHPISSTTSTSAPSRGIMPATGMRHRRAVSGPYEGDQAERLH